ncbi:MAG: hypothetical protein HY925_00785 [Elusimicrobia bacterium]|nr:hypothetical protein [Elusimicrobiota bacterium]
MVHLAAMILAASAWAAEPRSLADFQVPDASLSDPTKFGQFTDVSRNREDRALAPRVQANWTPRPQAAVVLPLLRPGPAHEPPTPGFVTLQQLPPLSDVREEKPKTDAIGLWTVAAVGIGLGLVVLGATGPRRREERVELAEMPPAAKRAKRSFVIQEELAPIESWTPEPQAPFGPIAEPDYDPGTIVLPPLPQGSRYAISAAEQRAIDLWDKSPEKNLGLASLPEWLDRHETRLRGVDVPLLKAKLERNV